jgi:hypothetical protein
MAAVSVIAAVVLSPAAAMACRIDNDGQSGGDYKVDVWFDCGVACGNYFTDIQPGTSVSRPGKSGKVQAQARDVSDNLGGGLCELGNRVSVGAHGEVGLTLSGPGADGFTWVSKGGNSWSSPIAHYAGTAVKTSEPCDWRGTP